MRTSMNLFRGGMSKRMAFSVTRTKPSFLNKSFLGGLFIFFLFTTAYGAPSHDPSTMIRNNDGRYWIFTTGTNVWAMSSSNANFTDWRVETSPFANGYPGWIHNYVSGFNGFFWAPDVIKMGNTYYLYYSCAGNGAAAAIGLATATDLRGPWTDRGMIVAGNNAIDPALYNDNGRLWMSWGNWQSGIDICELNASNGRRLNNSYTHLVSGQVEGPGLIRNGQYYYLFYQRGLCCNGLSSSYYMVVARSTSITGPYTNERVFLANRSGNQHGPGHFGYGEGKLTYHYYDVNANGSATLAITTLGWRNGWPVAGGSGGWETTNESNSYINGRYSLIATHSGKALDTYEWGTGNGTNICQWSYWGGEAQQFNITPVDGIWHRITPAISTGQALDVEGVSTADGANIFTWSYWGGTGQQFRFQVAGSGKWRIIARNSEKCLDIDGNSSDDGANVIQWTCIAGAANQMFNLTSANSNNELTELSNKAFNVYPNPSYGTFSIDLSSMEITSDKIGIELYSYDGKKVYSQLHTANNKIDMSLKLSQGLYLLKVIDGDIVNQQKISIK